MKIFAAHQAKFPIFHSSALGLPFVPIISGLGDFLASDAWRTWMSMRPVKRLMLFVSGLWAFVAVASLYSVHLARGTPDWYAEAPPSESTRAAAANESDQKLADMLSYASDIAAAHRRRLRTGPGNPADIIGPKTLTFSELQLNAFLAKWSSPLQGAASQVSRYIANPKVVLLDGRLVIAGNLPSAGILSHAVASVEFDPAVQADGEFSLSLSRVYCGRLPVAMALIGNPLRRLTAQLQTSIPQWESRATLSVDGIANRYAFDAAMGKTLLAGITSNAGESIVFLPCDLTDFRRFVPIRVTGVTLADRSVTIDLRPLSDDELKTLSSELHAPRIASAKAD
jgi:hypothetical protein